MLDGTLLIDSFGAVFKSGFTRWRKVQARKNTRNSPCLEGLYDLAPSYALRFSYREDDLIPFQDK